MINQFYLVAATLLAFGIVIAIQTYKLYKDTRMINELKNPGSKKQKRFLK